MRINQRVGVAFLVVAGWIGGLAVAHAGEPKPRRETCKGVTYAVEVTEPGGEAPSWLCLDMGKNAWLAPRVSRTKKPAVRTGRGFQWRYIADSRTNANTAFFYLEIEKLDGATFEEKTDAFVSRLRELWDGLGITLETVGKLQDAKRIKIGRESIQGLRLIQKVTLRDNGWRRDATTVFLPYHGYLVVLTSFCYGDYVAPVLKKLRLVDPKIWKKPQACRVVDFGGSPLRAKYFSLKIPREFACVPCEARVDAEKETEIAVWAVPGVPGTDAGTSLTLHRLRIGGDPVPLTDLAGPRIADLEKAGLTPSAPTDVKVDRRKALTWSARNEGGTEIVRWWIWTNASAAYGLEWKHTGGTPAEARMREAECEKTVRGLQTWASK